MRGPTGVPDTAAAVYGAFLQARFQRPQPTLGLDDVDAALPVHDGDARRIVAPVLEGAQAREQVADGVAAADISSDPTHMLISPRRGTVRLPARFFFMAFSGPFVLRSPAYL